ncbi:TPA: restriction endonuclease [Escherichia coli]|nr:restriction endonuclease [Escherichia coli]
MMQVPVITAVQMVSPVLMVCLAFCLLAVLLMLILRGGERKQKCARTRRHQRYRATAARLLARLKTQQGMTVIHNPCYSGDGGLDGQVVINGERWLIQAKRYGRTIRPAHIDAFGELLRREGCRGFFIHTGRTGAASRARLTLWPDIELVSGQRLLKLLNGTLLTDELTRGERR